MEGDAEIGLRLAAALWQFWWLRGHIAEGRRWLEQAIARGNREPTSVWIAVLRGAGVLNSMHGDHDRAIALHDSAIRSARQHGNPALLARVLHSASVVLRLHGDCQRAMAFAEESLSLMRTLDDQRGFAMALGNLADLHLLQDDVETAETYLEEALRVYRSHDLGVGVADVLHNMAWVAERRGEHEHAMRLGQQSLREYVRFGNNLGVPESIERIASAALSAGRYGRATRLLGVAMAVREAIGAPRAPTVEQRLEAAANTLRDTLGRAAFAEAWQAGRDLSFEEAVADALASDATELVTTPPPSR